MSERDDTFEQELGDALERLAQRAPAGPDAASVLASMRRRRRQRAAIGVAAVCALLAAGASVLLLRPWDRPSQPPAVVRAPAPQTTRTVTTQTPGRRAPGWPPPPPTMSLVVPPSPDLTQAARWQMLCPTHHMPESLGQPMPSVSFRLTVPRVSLPRTN